MSVEISSHLCIIVIISRVSIESFEYYIIRIIRIESQSNVPNIIILFIRRVFSRILNCDLSNKNSQINRTINSISANITNLKCFKLSSRLYDNNYVACCLLMVFIIILQKLHIVIEYSEYCRFIYSSRFFTKFKSLFILYFKHWFTSKLALSLRILNISFNTQNATIMPILSFTIKKTINNFINVNTFFFNRRNDQ